MRHQQNQKIARELGFVSKIVVIVISSPGQEIFRRMKLKMQDLSLRVEMTNMGHSSTAMLF